MMFKEILDTVIDLMRYYTSKRNQHVSHIYGSKTRSKRR